LLGVLGVVAPMSELGGVAGMFTVSGSVALAGVAVLLAEVVGEV
jgi:hypothetical protein